MERKIKAHGCYFVPLFVSSALHNEEGEAKGWRNPVQVRSSVSLREREKVRAKTGDGSRRTV